jgi:hypothetical protein
MDGGLRWTALEQAGGLRWTALEQAAGGELRRN